MSSRRHAIVTGGGSGLGLAIATALADSGYCVSIVGRDQARLDRALDRLPGCSAWACDVTQNDRVREVFGRIVEQEGAVHLLVNGAGIVRTAKFEQTGEADWTDMWRTNVMGAVNGCRALLPSMRDLPSGRIVNVASTASLKGYAYAAAYTATKHALLGLTRALAVELAGTAVTVNAVCPGYADTEMLRRSVAQIMETSHRTEAEALSALTSANPQGRLVDPVEVAAAVLWLASDAARSVTGQSITIAGGEVM